jgi:hypothetical protein
MPQVEVAVQRRKRLDYPAGVESFRIAQPLVEIIRHRCFPLQADYFIRGIVDHVM